MWVFLASNLQNRFNNSLKHAQGHYLFRISHSGENRKHVYIREASEQNAIWGPDLQTGVHQNHDSREVFLYSQVKSLRLRNAKHILDM